MKHMFDISPAAAGLIFFIPILYYPMSSGSGGPYALIVIIMSTKGIILDYSMVTCLLKAVRWPFVGR